MSWESFGPLLVVSSWSLVVVIHHGSCGAPHCFGIYAGTVVLFAAVSRSVLRMPRTEPHSHPRPRQP